MRKTMVYLPDEQYEGLRRLAFDLRTSVAALIRRAVEETYRPDLEDIRDMEEELARYRADPSSATGWEEYLRARAQRVSS